MRRERLLYVVVWSLIAVLPVVLELWKLINDSVFAWRFVLRWWSGMVPLIVIFLLHNHIFLPRFMKKGRMMAYAVAVLLVLGVYGGTKYYAHQKIREEFRAKRELRQMPPPPQPMFEFSKASPHRPFPFPVLFQLMLAAMTIGINVAISLTFTYSREQANRKELENSRLQEELKYLKQQISPHFLMNVLNNIHELAEENIKEAQNMILELSYLMRYVLYESDNDMTTLASESRFISSYVTLMKMRYVEDIVKVSLDLPDQASENVHVPPLLFVSFVENAFKHGVSYNKETTIDIRLYEKNGKIFFTCDNTVPHHKENAEKGGVGLANVRRRLDLLYGENYSLRINEEDDIHSVTLIIPCR